jgi:hypothetical protein
MNVSKGFNAHVEEAVATEEDYVLGGVSSLPKEVLCPERIWPLPKLEVQNKMFDPFACTNFANCNVRESIHLKRYGEEINNSDRYSAVISGTVPGQGNSHKNVAECTRKKWYVKEEEFPFTDSMSQEEFFIPSPELESKAISEIPGYEYGYEKVERSDFYEALQYSPLQVAVDSRTATTSEFQSYDHSVMLYGFKDGKWLVFDSYFGRQVEYDVDYPFGFALRFHYKRITPVGDKSVNSFYRFLACLGVVIK